MKPIENLCEDLPHEIKDYLNYCREMEYAEEPKYGMLTDLLKACMKRYGIDAEKPNFCWKLS